MESWPQLTSFLASHHGCIDRSALDAAAVSKRQLARLVADGRLTRVAPRVWVVAGSPDTWERQLMIGLLSLGRDAAVSHWAAARVHGLDGAGRASPEFIVPNGQHNSRLAMNVHRSGRLMSTDYVTVDGVRVTSATRTIFDLANMGVDRARVAAAMDSAVHLQLSAPEAIRRRLATIRGKGRGGVVLVEALLADSGGHTFLERAFLRLVRAEGLPAPRPQVVFESGGVRFARVDFLFEPWGIVVEVSGRRGHSSPAERARDAQRRNELQDVGLQVIEYTYEQVMRAPAWVRTTMRARLVAAGWTTSTPVA